MRALALVVALVLGACAGSADGPGGNGPCEVALSFTPVPAIVGEEVRVTTVVRDLDGVPTFTWRVRFDGADVPFEDALSTGSAIMFVPPQTGVYEVTVDVSAAESCPQASEDISVGASNANETEIRLHVIPPPDVDVPPSERIYTIPGGGDYALGPVVLEPGRTVTGTVTANGTGVPAYLRLMPLGMTGAVVEAYAGANGQFPVRVLNQMHEAIVIPSGNTLAPRRVSWTPASPAITVDAGSPVTGVVRHGANPIANAKVQLLIDGVPSTLATTAADGTFTVRSSTIATTTTRVTVTPPVSTGLPRLEADGTLDLAQPLDVVYRATLVTRNVGGVVVGRAGAPLANAKVSLVGTLAAVGNVIAGSSNLVATGTARVVVSANGSGALPSTLVPATPLSAVVEVQGSTRDYAISEFSTTTSVPPTIDAAAMTTRSIASGPQTLAGVRLSLVPAGDLALAGVPTIDVHGDATGTVTASVADDALYHLVWSDPAGRAGQLVARNTFGRAVLPTYMLPPALEVRGTLSVTGNPNPILGASVQVFCTSCGTGVDTERPIAEVASDQLGDFVLTIPDPGTM